MRQAVWTEDFDGPKRVDPPDIDAHELETPIVADARMDVASIRCPGGRGGIPAENSEIGWERAMPMYVVLYKWSQEGLENAKYSPTRALATTRAIKAAGGKVIGLWYTMGEYDVVTVAEWPTEQSAMAFMLAHASQGFVRTATLPAYTPTQFAEIVKMIP